MSVTRVNVRELEEWFEAREEGLFHVVMAGPKQKKADEPPEPPKPIVTQLTHVPFEIIGRLVPIDADQSVGLLVRYDKPGTGMVEVTVKLADVSSESELAKWLAFLGVDYETRKRSLISLYMHQSRKSEIIKAYTRNGWQKDEAFVVGDRVINGEGRVLAGAGRRSRFDAAEGVTFADWESLVRPLAFQKPGWVFGMLAGFSSPLLRPVGSNIGFTFNLTGPSTIGKTVALMAAANLWGQPHATGCLPSFNTTLNGVEALATEHADVGLFLDEMKKADPKIIRESIYMLANGSGKTAMTQQRELRATGSWSVNTLVSSEMTIEDLFAGEKQRQAAGQVVRAIDVRATATMFPKLDLAEVKAFEDALMTYYGVAGPEFVKRLRGRELRAAWDRHTTALYPGPDSRIQRAAGGFALLSLAGEIMGIEADVVATAFGEWADSGVDEAVDDNLQVAKLILEHVNSHMGSTILPIASASSDLGGTGSWDTGDSGTGEAGTSYRARDGWYANADPEECRYDRVWLTDGCLDGLRQQHGRQLFNEWAGEKGVVVRATNGGWKSWVPRSKPRKSGVLFNLDRLRDVAGA